MLPSPIIEGTLPAFYYSEQIEGNLEGGAIITVPFSMSRAVNKNQVAGFRLKMKSIQGSDLSVTLDQHKIDFDNYIVYFKLSEGQLEKDFVVGSFYKAQLAYKYVEAGQKDLGTGYYSTVGVIKYTTKPTVSILGLKKSVNNVHMYEYSGQYSQDGRDYTEKEYSYRFVVKGPDGAVLEDTGFLIHNNSSDADYYESKDTFLYPQELEENKKYSISYTVRTNNGLEESSPDYKIMAKTSVESTLKATLQVDLNHKNGYIGIQLQGEKNEFGLEQSAKGSFILSRTSEKSNFTRWDELDKFILAFEHPSSKSWKDFTIEQGIKYQYSVQQYNNEGLYSERILSDIVYGDFEDSFLYDGERQLKIKYNPKVTSFKKDILEAKVDTLGSKYPFIFRNGQVEYKEFPISGLISYLSDDESLFCQNTNNLYSTQERHETQRYLKVEDFPGESQGKIAREKRYKKDYLFFYFQDQATKQYVRWTKYLTDFVNKYYKNEEDRVYDWWNWERWEKEFKTIERHLYLPRRKREDVFNEDKHLLKTTNTVSYNIHEEREFKLEVLDWLTNGQPKLFKSPTEGNYLVRLMNTSLAPSDQVGRMLHTFSATAYEISDISYESLVQYGLIKVSDIEAQKVLKVISIPLSTQNTNYVKLNSHIDWQQDEETFYAQGQLLKEDQTAEWLSIVDMNPGDMLTINGNSIVIGPSGTYEAPVSVEQILLPNGSKSNGIITFGYYGLLNDAFSQIKATPNKDILSKQYIVEHKNILDYLQDTVKRVIGFYNIRIHERPIVDLYVNGENLIDGTGAIVGNLPADSDTPSLNFSSVNPLFTYRFTKEKYSSFGEYLYCPISFAATEKADRGERPPKASADDITIITYEAKRNASARHDTRPYLFNERDFNLLKNTKSLYRKEKKNEFPVLVEEDEVLQKDEAGTITGTYFIKENVTLIYDLTSGKVYLSPESYEYFKEMYKALEMEVNAFTSSYQSYEAIAFIDSRDFKVSETKVFETGNVGQITTLETKAGVYCELFYQEQNVNYDISKNAELKEKKALLDIYDEILTKDYMIEICYNQGRSSDFLTELYSSVERDGNTYPGVYPNYKIAYNDYLGLLESYLELEQEG